MKRNIRTVLIGQMILFIVVFLFTVFTCGPGISEGMAGNLSSIAWYLDIPSIIFILMILIPGLFIMGKWKDFIKSFSVGIKHYGLLELKNIILAISAAQKLTIYGALFAIIISGIMLLGKLSDPSVIGPNLAVCFLSGFYAVIIEFFLMPLRINAETKMNEEMDMGDE